MAVGGFGYAVGTAHSTGSGSASGVYSTRSGRCLPGTANTVFPRTQSPAFTLASYGYSGLGKSPYVTPLGSTRAPSAKASTQGKWLIPAVPFLTQALISRAAHT